MKIKHLAMAVALGLGISQFAYADTTSAIRGVVVNEAGQTVGNASIRLTDLRTGTSRTFAANDTGTFSARGLQVGGPYILEITDSAGRREVIENVFLTLGETQNINVTIRPADQVERIAVTGQMISNAAYGSSSPVAAFSQVDLENLPSINRDLTDIVAVDPRIYIDEGFARGIQCNGASPRFNSLTVDGVRMNDNFGLNNNGYPTERMPFSYDAIQQVAVEFAPFNVNYGGFTACNINAVTKSGANEMFGSVFFDFNNQRLRGRKIEGDRLDRDPFTEKRMGFNLGGALIKDTLFLFGAYEKYEGASSFDRGPFDANPGTPVFGLSQADLNRIGQIAQQQYGYTVGDPITSAPVDDEKLLLKLDWYINNDHRLAFTYNYNDGESISQAAGGNSNYEFSDHFYTRGAKFQSYVLQVFSDWTENFSTELRAGHSKLDNRQINLGGSQIGQVQIDTFANDTSATVYLGTDRSRQSNKLKYDTNFIKLAGTYHWGDHIIFGGYEREEYSVFNMFVQNSLGRYYFRNIDDFEAGTPWRIDYQNSAGSNNPADAAADFSYANNTLYLQDEYYMIDYDLTLTFGLRYDWYTSSERPLANQNFINRYGFSNDSNFDGMSLLQPRLGFNWNATHNLEVRGGFGLYSGGNPNVWLANGYQNDGATLIFNRIGVAPNSADTLPSLFETDLSGQGRPLYDVPASQFDAVANATNDGNVNALDPNFKLPSEWKYALGGTYTFENGLIAMADLMYTRSQNQSLVQNIALEQVGTIMDGRPVFAPREPGSRQDYLLTNASSDATNYSFSTSLSRVEDFGLSWTVAYAYTQAKDANPMTSSVAASNFNNFARSDFNDPRNATSNYEIPHRFTVRAVYNHEFIDGYKTTFSLVGSHNKGRPFSYTFRGQLFGDSTFDRQLLYIPTGLNDPAVEFGPDFDTDAFFAFVERTGLSKYAGRTSERNAFRSDWWTKVDLRIQQELPGFRDSHRAKAFLVVNNLTNMLNSSWGTLYEAEFPQAERTVTAELLDNGVVRYNRFEEPRPQGRRVNPSLWNVVLGIKYDF
ncbi:TonB-dependent receptor [Alkalimonas delamerensis]|uniref:TonB-dependent receptor n=1 Tax=Alkalimonas delamerensis TaxID=265981 RepID=A0ABT9GQY0_9GAMM|nr:TonB-dependent receptor [Alkalimonas delamerensis]MDP4529386.1 TonB-dependent receptor [Alkalimonas delamerensis]